MAKTLEFLEQFQRVLTPVRCTTGPLEEQMKEKTKKTMHMSCMNKQPSYLHQVWETWEMENSKLGNCIREAGWAKKKDVPGFMFDKRKKSISTVILTHCQAPPVL